MPVLTLCMGALVLAWSVSGGCGPSKTRPKEADVSGIPPVVLEQFRRDFPNDIILWSKSEKADSNGNTGEEWEIYHYTPLAKKKSTWYSADGVKLRGW